MAILNSFDAASLRLLAKKVSEIIDANNEALGGGNAFVLGDINATAQNYVSTTNYVRALRDVLTLCQQVEDELLGRNEKKQEARPLQ